MKATVIFTVIFVCGLITGLLVGVPDFLNIEKIKTNVLNCLLIFIGIGVGSDSNAFSEIKRTNLRMLLVPLLVAAGSIAGAGMIAMLLPLVGFRDGLAVGAGFGFYSLSSVILLESKGAQLAAIALISNLARELFTILFAAYIVKFINRFALIASAAATSMDVCLPVIQRYAGNQYTIIAIINGVVLTILVPILVPVFS